MYLAKDQKGRIGRQRPGVGMQADVEFAQPGDRRGNVYLSTAQIEDDQAYHEAKANQMRALAEAERVSAIAKRQFEAIENVKRANEIRAFQSLAKVDPMNEKLRKHFGLGMTRSQSENVASSVSSNVVQDSSDFSSTGGRPEIVLSNSAKRPIMWRADYRQHRITGNPLTRDGAYGPAVTDYDRYVNGVDVNQENVVDIAGGTILGRYNGANVTETWANAMKNQETDDLANARNRQREMKSDFPMSGMGAAHPAMGFDWSWGGITDWAGGVVDQTVDNLSDKLPDQLAKELQSAIQGGGTATPNASTGVITVTRPVTQPSTISSISQSTGLPPWALYSFIGLFGIGVLFIGIKAVRR